MAISDELKNKFYEDLRVLLATVPKVKKVVFPGEFNACVGTNKLAGGGKGQRELDPHRIVGYNDTSLLLLRTCAEHRLASS
nr:unnamed protein product [Spirometra erinaceieuropaei]